MSAAKPWSTCWRNGRPKGNPFWWKSCGMKLTTFMECKRRLKVAETHLESRWSLLQLESQTTKLSKSLRLLSKQKVDPELLFKENRTSPTSCVKLPCKTPRDISCQDLPWELEQRNWFETKSIYFKKHNVLKLCWQHLHVLQAALISEGQHTWVAPCDHFLPPTNASPRMLSASMGSGVNNRLHCHPTHPKNSNPVLYAWCIHIQWILKPDGTFLQWKQVLSYMRAPYGR